ncbi:hypothetical protein [Streptomyces sp. PSKA30]|uniref:hypothetical protein n=1 Tax=Streptomyces sp. PSKA30 TaxID=2874597 RepID=UPI001CD14A95|nr:hypothetical protein [Streptomyces sp. PSKA30]MBZ9644912.1 hypothetical protein [Streptomyces sp. PSKA30]
MADLAIGGVRRGGGDELSPDVGLRRWLHYLVDPVAISWHGHEASVLVSGNADFTGAHRDLMDGRADLPRVGAVVEGIAPSLPYVVVDGASREIEPVSGTCGICCWAM